MSKFILMVLLNVVSCNAMAAWVEITKSYDSIDTYYGDPDTIRKNGNIVKMWTLQDYKKPENVKGEKYLSSRAFREFDCKEERARIIAITTFIGSMGHGGVLSSEDSDLKWSYIAPGTINKAGWQFACGVT